MAVVSLVKNFYLLRSTIFIPALSL